MKNTIIKILLIILTITASLSCKKSFLDTPDTTFIVREAYIVDLNTTNQYLNGVYTLLPNFFHGLNLIYPEMVADNLKPQRSDAFFAHYSWKQIPNSEFNNGSPYPSDLNLNPFWQVGYQIIRSLNLVIEKAELYKQEDVARANRLLAEAYSLRALIHFNLVNYFSQPYGFSANAGHPGIPYVTTSKVISEEKRLTVANVYDKLIEDLKLSLNYFPASTISKLYANRNMAMALLSRILLFKQDYRQSVNYAAQVIQSVPLMSSANFVGNFYTSNESEALFQLPPSNGTNAGASSNYSNFSGQYLTSTSYSVAFYATQDIVDLLNESNSDARRNWVQTDGTNWFVSKFPKDIIPGFFPPEASYYLTLLRSSEMYLNMSESYSQMGSSYQDSSRYYLDAIRLRADNLATPSNISGQQLVQAIQKERRKEMAFEGLRMFDIQRWKQSVTRADYLPGSPNVLAYPAKKAVAPLPTIDVEQAGLTQNEDY